MTAPTDTPPVGTRTRAGINTTYVWVISAAAAMGGLLFGYDWIVISGTDLFYGALSPDVVFADGLGQEQRAVGLLVRGAGVGAAK